MSSNYANAFGKKPTIDEWSPMVIVVKGPTACGKSTAVHAMTLILDGLQRSYKVMTDIPENDIDRRIDLMREAHKKSGKIPPNVIIIDGILACPKKIEKMGCNHGSS